MSRKSGNKLAKLAVLSILLIMLVLLIAACGKVTGIKQSSSFPDAGLEQAIRHEIGKPEGTILESDLENMTSLAAGYLNITDLTGLEKCVNLTSLKLQYNDFSDLTPLANLTKLTKLDLMDSNVSDLSALANLTDLTYLNLAHCRCTGTDLAPLANLVNLKDLSLFDTADSGTLDIAPLVDNPGLSEGDILWLGSNNLSSNTLNIYIPQLQARGVEVHY